jgi:membrane fusion protein (multidrug efflux system)
MASPFSRTLRALDADSFGRTALVLLVVLVVLGGWTAWFVYGEVSVFAVTRFARLEVHTEVFPVEAPVGGRIVASQLTTGVTVREGDLLAEIESTQWQLEHSEERARIAALEQQLSALRAELRAEGDTLGISRRSTDDVLNEARARHDEAQAHERFAEDQLRRLEALFRGGHATESEYQKARSELKQKRAASEAARVAVLRLGWGEKLSRSDRRTRIQRLRRDAAQIQGEVGTRRATLDRLEFEVERRRIVAPAAGKLGEALPLRVGNVVREGDRLATVVPAGEVKVVAEFQPSDALGRVRVGQGARMRLDGFPWAQYGTLAAKVALVATEPRFGRVRVELTVDKDSWKRIPLQHGLPGSVEVEIERVSPATLALRAVGHLIGGSDGP